MSVAERTGSAGLDVVHRASRQDLGGTSKVHAMLTAIADACPPRRQYLAGRAHLKAAGLGPAAVAAAQAEGHLVRVRRGVYSSSPLPTRATHLVSGGSPDPAYVAQLRAALMSLGSTAMAGGRTAAVLWGFDLFVEPKAIEVVVPASRQSRAPKGVALRRARGAVAVDRSVLGGEPLRVLTPALTVADCAFTRPLREAVVIADSALRTGQVSVEELERVTASLAHHPQGRRLRRVMDLVDPASGSVLESLCRLLLVEHGMWPESQVTLADPRGRAIGRVDFLFRDQRLVVECDGRRWHDPEDARGRDRTRDNELERAAWRLVRVTWYDVVHRPEYVIQLVRDCLAPWPNAA